MRADVGRASNPSRFNPLIADAPAPVVQARTVLCAICGDHGYTGMEPTEFISRALVGGTACRCAAGAQFADWQMRWIGGVA